ncbi:MAG: histidine phosphatase family protein [Rikenellaceae bacterium]|nr:histidine phosphatase family protein [Rikenellaceae bacterium]
MSSILIIARHGNTFRPGETPTRVGAKTDLPLVETHCGTSIGKYLINRELIPSEIHAAPLLRTMQTAELAIEAMGIDLMVKPNSDFTEIDYGPDENRTEEEVMSRLGGGDPEAGKTVLDAWNANATVPEGWKVDPERIIANWLEFAAKIADKPDKITMLVSSNGIIRFAPYITGDFQKFSSEHDIKVVTGGLCIFRKEDTDKFWTCVEWNVKPYKYY